MDRDGQASDVLLLMPTLESEAPMKASGFALLALTVTGFAIPIILSAQANNPTPQPASPDRAPSSTLPFPMQIRKTVVFLETDCEPTANEQATLTPLVPLPPQEQTKWLLHQYSQMKRESLAKFGLVHSGTGFIVGVEDQGLPKDRSYLYLVTNRHVAQPGIEQRTPCKVVNYYAASNLKDDKAGGNDHADNVALGANLDWTFSDDPSVDLAITPITANVAVMDFLSIPLGIFVTQEMLDQNKVVEGDPILFAGLFVQWQGARKVEPIVRSGTLAMMPRACY